MSEHHRPYYQSEGGRVVPDVDAPLECGAPYGTPAEGCPWCTIATLTRERDEMREALVVAQEAAMQHRRERDGLDDDLNAATEDLDRAVARAERAEAERDKWKVIVEAAEAVCEAYVVAPHRTLEYLERLAAALQAAALEAVDG